MTRKKLYELKSDFLKSSFKHEAIKKVLLKDLSLMIQCEKAGEFSPMFSTDLYNNKGGCYCELLRYFYCMKTEKPDQFKRL